MVSFLYHKEERFMDNQNRVTYIVGHQKLTDNEFYKVNDSGKLPTCIACIQTAFMESFVYISTDYGSLKNFMEKYTWDAADIAISAAQTCGALLFTWCEELNKLYVPERSIGAGEELVRFFTNKDKDDPIPMPKKNPYGVLQRNVAIVDWETIEDTLRRWVSKWAPHAEVCAERENHDFYVTFRFVGDDGTLCDGLTAEKLRDEMKFILNTYEISHELDYDTEKRYGEKAVLEDFFDMENPEDVELPVTVSCGLVNALLHLWGDVDRFCFVNATEQEVMFVYATNETEE